MTTGKNLTAGQKIRLRRAKKSRSGSGRGGLLLGVATVKGWTAGRWWSRAAWLERLEDVPGVWCSWRRWRAGDWPRITAQGGGHRWARIRAGRAGGAAGRPQATQLKETGTEPEEIQQAARWAVKA